MDSMGIHGSFLSAINHMLSVAGEADGRDDGAGGHGPAVRVGGYVVRICR